MICLFLIERGADWKNDSALNDSNTTGDADLAEMVMSSSPPKDSGGDRKTRLFRTASGAGGGNKKKQALNFSTTSEQLLVSSQNRSAIDTCLSPTNVEPRKILLDQLARIFTAEINILPEVVIMIGPQEPHGGTSSPKIGGLLSATFKSTFSPLNTAEVKAILSALMNKIQKQ